MKRNNFFANAASKALALAAVVMMSAAFAACSSSNDEPTPPPSSKAGTVTLDGVEKPILKAEYDDNGNGNYSLYLNLSADGKEKVKIELNKDQHITGSPIDLTEKEKQHGDNWCWVVEYYKPDDTKLIDTFGVPDAEGGLYTTGTLTISGSLDGTINIRLENGRVNGTDGKEHTFVLNYSGTMTKSEDDPTPEPLPEPKAQTVTLDGAEKPILKAEYKDRNDGDYFLFLYLSADGKEKVEIDLNKELHITGSPIDLTEKEKKHDGKCYWVVEYYKPNGNKLIETWANPGYIIPVFTTGTLTISGSFENINIRLENGRVEGEDGKEHTLTISYSGTMEKVGGETPKPKDNIVTIDGKEKSIVKAEYRYHNNGNYRFHLYLSADGKERVIIDLNKDLHITGNPVDLTKKEKKRDGKFYWEVDYYKPDATSLIHTYARPGFEDPVFTTGTLTMSGSPDGTINIRLENGRVKGEDNKEHTLTVSYSGPMTKA